jgi:CelD/BcsL family acetyltransferase involved in cellulose biosynthesis
VTTPTLTAEPVCPSAVDGSGRTATASTPIPQANSEANPHARFVATRRPFDSIDQVTWDGLLARNPWATPFSSWAFQQAWWDAYGASAHDETLVVVPTGPDGAGLPGADPIGIVPLMHRHEVEPSDLGESSRMRHSAAMEMTAVPGTATAIFFGASYHADYASLLAAPADFDDVAEAVAAHLASPAGPEWDAIDLRRLRCGDPAAEALAAAFGRREGADGWTLNLEREDVCPVVTLPVDADFDGYLATLGGKERHEIRRKIRRAEAVGPISLTRSLDPLADLPAFIELHQKRWGDEGLFPGTPGGTASRTFFQRLFELLGPSGPLVLSFLSVGDRRIGAGVHLEDGRSLLYYNAGMDPDARELSPGVLMAAAYVQAALAGRFERMDFLRGNEPYKYEWGAEDEPIQRLLVRRSVG